MEGMPTSASSGRGPKFWMWLVLILVAFIFVAVNFQKVTVDFIIAEGEAPLVLALLIAGVLGFVIGLALPRFRGPRN